MNRKLSSAYADAVLDFLETGARQGIVYEDGLFVFKDDTELSAMDEPLMWVDEQWSDLVGSISAPIDPTDVEFSKLRLRAQIIEALVDSSYIRRVAAHFGELSPPNSIPPPVAANPPASPSSNTSV